MIKILLVHACSLLSGAYLGEPSGAFVLLSNPDQTHKGALRRGRTSVQCARSHKDS